MNISEQLQQKYEPTEITKCKDSGVETAWFDHYTGIYLMKIIGAKQTTEIEEIRTTDKYICSCGQVAISVSENTYPQIKRRIF